MSRPRAADDFVTIRARMGELQRERERELAATGPAAADKLPARRGESDAERRRRERMDGAPPPWVPTIFVRRPRG